MKQISHGVPDISEVAKGVYEKVGITVEMIECSRQEQAWTFEEMGARLQAAEENTKEMLKETAEALDKVKALLYANPRMHGSPGVEGKQCPLIFSAIGLMVSQN